MPISVNDPVRIRLPDEQGSGEGQFNHPVGLALDDSGNLHVVDQDNYRVQKFFTSESYLPYPFQVGQYTLTATPYSQANSHGEKGWP